MQENINQVHTQKEIGAEAITGEKEISPNQCYTLTQGNAQDPQANSLSTGQINDQDQETNNQHTIKGAVGAARTVTPQDHSQPHKADLDPGQPPSET